MDPSYFSNIENLVSLRWDYPTPLIIYIKYIWQFSTVGIKLKQLTRLKRTQGENCWFYIVFCFNKTHVDRVFSELAEISQEFNHFALTSNFLYQTRWILNDCFSKSVPLKPSKMFLFYKFALRWLIISFVRSVDRMWVYALTESTRQFFSFWQYTSSWLLSLYGVSFLTDSVHIESYSALTQRDVEFSPDI
jgi:hypothetical protein